MANKQRYVIDFGFHQMMKFNEELAKAGVLLAAEGLHPSSKGARVRFSGNKVTVTDGPFAETKELIGGFWLWQCKSKAEAIEWVKRIPHPNPEVDGAEREIEIRQFFDMEEFGDAITPEIQEIKTQEERIHSQMAAKK